MLLVKESIIKEYNYDEKGNIISAIAEEVEQYRYIDEEEKLEHKKQMEKLGFIDSGQVRKNIGTVMNPIYIWFGNYYRYKDVE